MVRSGQLFVMITKKCRLFKIENHVFDCPNLFLFHLYGQLPHLIDDAYLKLDSNAYVKDVPIENLYENFPLLQNLGTNINDYTANTGTFFYPNIDPCYRKKEYSSKFKIKSSSGLTQIKPQKFVSLLKILSPSICEIPADIVWDSRATSTRHLKSHRDSMTYIDELLKLRTEPDSEFPPNIMLFGAALGGRDVKFRTLAATELSDKPVDGYTIENLAVLLSPYLLPWWSMCRGAKEGKNSTGNNTPTDSERDDFESATKDEFFNQLKNYKPNLSTLSTLIQASTLVLPEEKPKLLQGPWDPLQMICAVRAGIDLFDSSYTYTLTQRGLASNFAFAPGLKNKSRANSDDFGVPHFSGKDESSCHGFPFTIDLNEPKYASDFGPLVDGCDCYTCTKYSRAYVNHLLNCSELLAGILLSIHNLDALADFFEYLRAAIKNGQLDAFEEVFRMQLPV